MKASKFSDAQEAFILRQGAERTPVADICRKAGGETFCACSAGTVGRWRPSSRRC